MNSFEKEYYEHEGFWEGDMLHDENNAKRIRETSAMIPASVKSLLDVGCGNGVFVNYLSEAKPELKLMAVDRSEAALKFVRSDKAVGDINQLSFADRSFDCVSCLEVIEHLPSNIYKQSLNELARVAGEYVIISVPFEEKLEESFNQCPSCKSIFSYEMHLRRYTDEIMQHLLDEFGFKCIQLKKEGPEVKYKGHYTFRKIFYKKQFRRWLSPICPMCGYKEATTAAPVQAHHNHVPAPQRSIISRLTALPKLVWPKETKYYWIIGLYQRVK
jgi:ubiquinone/menaquinone biosynthesis C-methylase UbiE